MAEGIGCAFNSVLNQLFVFDKSEMKLNQKRLKLTKEGYQHEKSL